MKTCETRLHLPSHKRLVVRRAVPVHILSIRLEVVECKSILEWETGVVREAPRYLRCRLCLRPVIIVEAGVEGEAEVILVVPC